MNMFSQNIHTCDNPDNLNDPILGVFVQMPRKPLLKQKNLNNPNKPNNPDSPDDDTEEKDNNLNSPDSPDSLDNPDNYIHNDNGSDHWVTYRPSNPSNPNSPSSPNNSNKAIPTFVGVISRNGLLWTRVNIYIYRVIRAISKH